MKQDFCKYNGFAKKKNQHGYNFARTRTYRKTERYNIIMADIKILTGNHRKHNNSDLQYHNLYYQPPRQFEHLNIMLRSKYKDNF